MTVAFGFTTAPVPTLRSRFTSFFGGGPTVTGTAGAPAGSGPDTATHGLSATDPGAVVVVEEVELVSLGVVVLLAAGLPLLLVARETSTTPIPTASTTPTATRMIRCRRTRRRRFDGCGGPGFAVLPPAITIGRAHGAERTKRTAM